MMRPELLVMAAGMGSRFGGLKQLEPVGPCGECVMDYSIYDAKRAGIERVVFVIRKEFENDFHQRMGARYAKWMDVAYVFQEIDLLPKGFTVPVGRQKPWGTAHAILAAKNALKSPFIACNADDFYGRNAFITLASWLSGPLQSSSVQVGVENHVTDKLANWLTRPIKSGIEQYAMIAFRMANTLSANGTVARGVCELDEGGLLKTVKEHTALEPFEDGVRNIQPDGTIIRFSGVEPVSMNFWGFHPSLFEYLEELFIAFLKEHGQELKSEFYIPSVVDGLIRGGKASVRVLDTPDCWFGVTYREDSEFVVSRIRELVKSGVYPHSLWS